LRADFKHVSLEMGGKNIIVVMDDANLDLAIDGAVWRPLAQLGSGARRLSRGGGSQKSVCGICGNRFVDRVKTLKVGNGLDSAIEMGPCITNSN